MNELLIIENLKPQEIFVPNGLDPILNRIEKEVKSHALDISNDNGRKFVASLAYKVAQSKTALDELGKNLTEEWKTKSKAVDAERKRMRDRLDQLKEEVRQPLTDWENAEKERVAMHESDIAEIVNGGVFTLQNWQTINFDAMKERLEEIKAEAPKNWQEFAVKANEAIKQSVENIASAIQKREVYEAEQAELVKLRQAEAERQQKEREDRIAAEAAAKAKSDAEAIAKEAETKAENQRLALQREKEAAEERARKAEEEASLAAARAVKAEQDRLCELKKQDEAAAVKREADKKHKAKINNEALQALLEVGLAENQGKVVIEAIAKSQVPHIKIQY